MLLSNLGMFHNVEEAEVAIREWLQMKEPHWHRGYIFNLLPRWDNCNSLLDDEDEE